MHFGHSCPSLYASLSPRRGKLAQTLVLAVAGNSGDPLRRDARTLDSHQEIVTGERVSYQRTKVLTRVMPLARWYVIDFAHGRPANPLYPSSRR